MEIMKKIICFLTLFLMMSIEVSHANPIFNTVDGNWTNTVLVYSNEKTNVYIPESLLTMNVFYTKYRENGNFSFVIYEKLNDEDVRQIVINSVNDDINNNVTFLTGYANIQSIRYVQTSAYDLT